MRSLYIAFIGCLLAFTSCSTNTGKNSSQSSSSVAAASVSAAPVQSRLSDTGTQLLMSVVARYYTLKNAMVATKEADAATAATQLASTAENLLSVLQKDTVNRASLIPFLDTIATQSKLVTNVKDETCEKQRLAFGTISSAMYGLLKATGLKNAHVYHEYCPMAFNDKGAFWLSEETDIKNPYFGKKMLECGEVTDTL